MAAKLIIPFIAIFISDSYWTLDSFLDSSFFYRFLFFFSFLVFGGVGGGRGWGKWLDSEVLGFLRRSEVFSLWTSGSLL